MDSIENLFSYMSVPRPMINIWEYSDHVHHIKHDKKIDCKCEKYLNMCINAARDSWDNESYIFLTVLFINFNFIEKNMLF